MGGYPGGGGAGGVTMIQAQTQYVQLPPAPSTNPYPYGRHSLFAPAAPAAAPAAAPVTPGAAGIGGIGGMGGMGGYPQAPAVGAGAAAAAPLPPSLPAGGLGFGGNGFAPGIMPRSVVNVRTPGRTPAKHGLARQGELR